MIIDYYVVNNTKLYIEFNETVVIASDWVGSDWAITIDGPIPPYDFTWDLPNPDERKTTGVTLLEIDLSINSQLYGLETLNFTFEDRLTTISATYGTETQNTTFLLPLDP